MIESVTEPQTKLDYWKKLSDEWQASGLTQPEFCKQIGISYAQFGYWRTKILSSTGKAKHNLKPVTIKPAATHANGLIQAILPNGVKLQIPHNVSEASLSLTITLLGVL